MLRDRETAALGTGGSTYEDHVQNPPTRRASE